MKRKLIVSYDTYSWINYCAGFVLRNSELFSVIIVSRDDDRPVYGCTNLCPNAIYEQRIFDLFKIGKELGVKKILNLNYNDWNMDVEKLIMYLQLYITIGGTAEVYYQPVDIVEDILIGIKNKFNVDLFSYKTQVDEKDVTEILLSDAEITRKFGLRELMVGINNLDELPSSKTREIFYKR